MKCNTQNRECHAERSEASLCASRETLRCAQGDKSFPILLIKFHHRGGERRSSQHCGRTRCSFLGRHCGLDCSQERLQFIRIIVAYPIDEEGGCAVHSTAYTAQEILVHALGIHALSHLALERLLIQIQSDSIVD